MTNSCKKMTSHGFCLMCGGATQASPIIAKSGSTSAAAGYGTWYVNGSGYVDFYPNIKNYSTAYNGAFANRKHTSSTVIAVMPPPSDHHHPAAAHIVKITMSHVIAFSGRIGQNQRLVPTRHGSGAGVAARWCQGVTQWDVDQNAQHTKGHAR